MRTTVTLDPDVEQIVRRLMRERNIGFKEALNGVIRRGALGSSAGERFETATSSMGQTQVNLDRALQVAASLEDDELVRRMEAGS